MDTFIEQSVKFLYDKYGTEISNINIIFPSRRGKMFFNMALSHIIKGTPIWQPHFLTMDDLIKERSGIEEGDKLRLLVELYKIFNNFHNESFDKFYFWGEVLLSDFDMIDNYLIDAKLLYTNIKDIKEIEAIFGDASREQIELISAFWGNINGATTSIEKSKFINIWNTLFEIYTLFRKRLLEIGIGYKGMISRIAAENDLEGEKKRYAIIGFNALSNSEKAIFKNIKAHHECVFLWDFDNYYISSQHEAGLFLRENIKTFGESNTSARRDNFVSKKDIHIIASPTDSLSAKYTYQFLEECATKSDTPLAQETAIVMTDESLLLPIMYSIPKSIEAFNVTSGYELRITQQYALVEQLISLQGSVSEGKFYHKDIRNILTHSDILALMTSEEIECVDKYIERVTTDNIIFDTCELLFNIQILKDIFEVQKDSNAISLWLTKIIKQIIASFDEGEDTLKSQFYFTIHNTIIKTQSLFEQCGMEVSTKVYIAALRKVLQGTKISFDGEPLIGVQVMGILETRNIDFKNVLLLSVSEDTFPSNSGGKSFIPPNLRLGYGLPTISHHEAMYSYYFYRLLQRAERVDIVYCSGSGGLRSGEPSRYIHQLRYESTHAIDERTINVNVTIKDNANTSYKKDPKCERYYDPNSKSYLSPTAIISFLECPLRFYYKYIEGIDTDQEAIKEQIDDRILGNIIHKTLQEIYTPLIMVSNKDLIFLLQKYDKQKIGVLVDKNIKETLQSAYNENSGDLSIKRQIMVSYINNAITFDIGRNDGFMIKAIEEDFRGEITINNKTIKLGGKIDRVDAMPDGSIKIIDYKSGSKPTSNNLDKIFDRNDPCNNSGLVQILLYSLLWSKKYGCIATPNLYYLRDLQDSADIDTKEFPFEEKLNEVISELVDMEKPFCQTTIKENCKYCPFTTLCTL